MHNEPIVSLVAKFLLIQPRTNLSKTEDLHPKNQQTVNQKIIRQSLLDDEPLVNANLGGNRPPLRLAPEHAFCRIGVGCEVSEIFRSAKVNTIIPESGR